jgi:hypothetical protein
MSFLLGDKNAKLANDLVVAARVPAPLVEATKAELIKLFKKSPPKDPQRLIKLVNHPCQYEQLFEKQYPSFLQRWNSPQFRDSGPDDLDLAGVQIKDALVNSFADHLSKIIGLGYDQAFKDNLVFDEAGNPIDIVEGQGVERMAKCREFLRSSKQLQKTISSAESDPYKGSEQGILKAGRKKTRKHSKKSKKTLKRKIRR